MSMTYYYTRWRGPGDKLWRTSTITNRTTLELAKQQLVDDVGYFYSDITIELIEVTEKVIETGQGSQSRQGPIIKREA